MTADEPSPTGEAFMARFFTPELMSPLPPRGGWVDSAVDRLRTIMETSVVLPNDEYQRLRAIEQRLEECETWCGREEMHRAVRYIRTGGTS